MCNKIALFDFDGTISRGDSLFVFMIFLSGKKVFYLGVLQHSHWFFAYLLGWINNAGAKEKLVEHFLKEMREDFLQKCEEFLPLLESIIKLPHFKESDGITKEEIRLSR